jgi:predicted phage-related endonuclease
MIERFEVTSRTEWLERRKADITASNIGALFNAHPYTTALKLYVEKRGVEFDNPDNKAMRRGRWLEPAVGKAVEELRPEWKLTPAAEYLRDPEHRIGATPDFYIHGDPRGRGVLQAKTVAPSVYAREWANGETVPLWISLQAATEAMLTDSAFSAVAVLLVDPHNMDCVIHELPRHPSAEMKILAAVHEFWRMVDAGIEPEPDFARDAAVIRAMYRREESGKPIDLTGNNKIHELLDERAGLQSVVKSAEVRVAEIDAEIKFTMGEADHITGLNGWRVTFKTSDFKEYTVPARSTRILRVTDKREGK